MEDFFQKLESLKAYRKDREVLADKVIHQPDYFEYLLSTCFQVNENISYKAAWILELVCIQKPELLFPRLDDFVSELPNVYRHQSVRPMAKICEVLLTHFYDKNDHPIQKQLTKKHRAQLTEICFDWLISEQKVAAKAYAMQCLFILGKDFDWIHPELKIILEKEFPTEQPAFKARAKHILNKLK